jgi:hypothetical protein
VQTNSVALGTSCGGDIALKERERDIVLLEALSDGETTDASADDKDRLSKKISYGETETGNLATHLRRGVRHGSSVPEAKSEV